MMQLVSVNFLTWQDVPVAILGLVLCLFSHIAVVSQLNPP